VKKNAYGFTIIELLIVIVVIGVLASVSVVAYSGVQHRALNTARYHEVMAWHNLMQAYVAQIGKLPPVADGSYCLGTGFPDGDGVAGGECRDFGYPPYAYHEIASVGLMNELKKVSPNLPIGPHTGVNGTIGPYITTYPASYTITTVFNGNQASDCPSGMLYSWSDGNGRLLCQIDFSLL
jgi:general secretion pathway protein G